MLSILFHCTIIYWNVDRRLHLCCRFITVCSFFWILLPKKQKRLQTVSIFFFGLGKHFTYYSRTMCLSYSIHIYGTIHHPYK
uniref:Uncharacterized protein n=1 Tax=Arundo donax TaxID=35708 RepID=A0A0A9GXH7_ARUDO